MLTDVVKCLAQLFLTVRIGIGGVEIVDARVKGAAQEFFDSA